MSTPPSAAPAGERVPLLPCPSDALWMGPKLERHEGQPPGELCDWTPMNATAREWRDAITTLPTVCKIEWIKRENSAQTGWYVLQDGVRLEGPFSSHAGAETWACGFDTAWNRRPQRPPAPSAAPEVAEAVKWAMRRAALLEKPRIEHGRTEQAAKDARNLRILAAAALPPISPEVAALADRLEALAKKATPGPWNATTWPEGAFMITAGETVDPDSGVVLCQRQDWNHNAEESRANGQLIGDLVNNLPTIIAALRSAPDGWTRFEDRWPPRCEPVLIGRYATEVRPDYWVGCKAHWYEYADKREWSFHGQASSYILDGDGPTHWRPLPPPPAKAPRDEGGGE